jgi:Protein of unknown function (DUF4230)
MKEVNKLITLELELSQMVTIDKSLGNLELLKKYKKVTFFADCSYYIDLSKISNEDIIIDSSKGILTLTVPKPEVYDISINEDKTTFEESENGLLRFGEIKLSTEEFNNLQNGVNISFEEKLKADDIFKEALSRSKSSVETWLNNLINEKVKVYLYFK